MGVFNHNMRFLRNRLKLSQQKMADALGEKRGKLAAYEENAHARPEFYEKLVVNYSINMQKFLFIEMNDDNYSSFFTTNQDDESTSLVMEPEASYQKKDMAWLLNQVRNENDKATRAQLVDSLNIMIGKLEDEKNEVQTDLMNLLKKMRNF